MLTVRIFSYTRSYVDPDRQDLYDLERKLTWSHKDRIVADDHCPLSYILRTMESYGLKPTGQMFFSEAQQNKDGSWTEYHASLDGISDASRARLAKIYPKF